MIVVDTTVWVDFLRGRQEPHVTELISLIKHDAGVALTGVIDADFDRLAEVTSLLVHTPRPSQA